MNVAMKEIKVMVRRHYKHMVAKLPEHQYGDSQEAVAVTLGAKNWRTLHDQASKNIAKKIYQPEKEKAPEEPIQYEGDRYIICDGWGHIFGNGLPETTVRFVFDKAHDRVIDMEINCSRGWVEATEEQMLDVTESLQDNEIATKADDFGCETSDEILKWAEI